MIAKGELNRAEAAAATPIGRLGQGEEIAGSVKVRARSHGGDIIVHRACPDAASTAPTSPHLTWLARRPAALA
jgi:hypothetical protein